MNNQGASQPTVTVASSPTIHPPNYPPSAGSNPIAGLAKVYVGDEPKREEEWSPEFRETFSKGILKMRMQEYLGGKYTKRYIDAYLEFMVLSGMINNLDYLEFKRDLTTVQL